MVISKVAVDDTILKYNGEKCYLFAAVDVERNKVLHLRVHSARNALVAPSFLRAVLRKYDVKELILDKGPWYRGALRRLGVNYRHGRFGGRSLVESFFSSFKQRVRIFFSSITVNLRKRKGEGLGDMGALECWNRLCGEGVVVIGASPNKE